MKCQSCGAPARPYIFGALCDLHHPTGRCPRCMGDYAPSCCGLAPRVPTPFIEHIEKVETPAPVVPAREFPKAHLDKLPLSVRRAATKAETGGAGWTITEAQGTRVSVRGDRVVWTLMLRATTTRGFYVTMLWELTEGKWKLARAYAWLPETTRVSSDEALTLLGGGQLDDD